MDRQAAFNKNRPGRCFIAWTVAMAVLHGLVQPLLAAPAIAPSAAGSGPADTVTIERIPPERTHGQGYRLAYHVKVPIAAYWRFKIDFDNNFLIENKYIRDHRLIYQSSRVAITENKYTFGPDVFFRWQTTIDPERRRLDFVLLNPEECRQHYQYGSIQLEPEGSGTRVIQKAYFDFWGAAFWAYFPWQGGMKDFLTYTAEWEQTTALRLKDRYDTTRRTE